MTALITVTQPFRLDQLPMLGLDPQSFARLERAGAYRRVLRGVYVDAAVPDSRLLRTAAAKLIRPPHGVLMGCSASWVMGGGHVRAYCPVRPHAGVDGAARYDPLGAPGRPVRGGLPRAE